METAEISGARIKLVDARSFLIKPINNARIGACTKPINACEYYNAETGYVPCKPDSSNCPD